MIGAIIAGGIGAAAIVWLIVLETRFRELEDTQGVHDCLIAELKEDEIQDMLAAKIDGDSFCIADITLNGKSIFEERAALGFPKPAAVHRSGTVTVGFPAEEKPYSGGFAY